MLNSKNQIPKGVVDYYGKEANLRDYVLKKIEEIYKKYGFDPLYTPVLENAEVFNGHHGEGEKLLFKLEDSKGEKYVLKYDSTVPLARVISMYDDIRLPYKRYQLQQSYRDDEVDKGHYREFVQCDGDIVGAKSLVSDAEFILISYDGLRSVGFEDFTIRLNHRKIIKAIAEKANIYDNDGILSIQRAIDIADKINKGGISDVKKELAKTNINGNVIDIIIDLIEITNSCNNVTETLDGIQEYFQDNVNAKEGISELREIVSYVSPEILKKTKIDFTLARGADYYTGFIIEAVINGLNLGAVLGGGRYDNLVQNFGVNSVPAVGMAFGLERIIVAMKELELNKHNNITDTRILVYSPKDLGKQAINVGTYLREKYNTSIIFEEDLPIENLHDYCEKGNFSIITEIKEDSSYELYDVKEFITKKTTKQKVKIKA